MGVMGQGIALNCSENRFETAVYNRFVKGEERIIFDFLAANSQFENLYGFTDILSFINALERPRKIWLMIKSGSTIDRLIDEITPLLEEGDIITIDSVNNVLSVNVSDEDLAQRRAQWQPYEPRYKRGVLAKYAAHVTSASTGAVTDKFE